VSEKPICPPVAGSSHVNATTATLLIPPRPDLPARLPGAAPAPPPLPPGWKVPTPGSASDAHRGPRARRAWRAITEPRVLLGAYVVVLSLIALWPTPVDGGAGPFLRLVARVAPVLTYARIEFGANILLFVPLGVLLALILRHRHLIAPIALVATVAIESAQALMIDRRTPSVMDIIANLTGACLGLLIVAFVEWRRSRGADSARRHAAGAAALQEDRAIR
jgi:VanZ family protein